MPTNTCLEPPFTTAGHPSLCSVPSCTGSLAVILGMATGATTGNGEIPQTSALACVFRNPETVWSEAERQHENLQLAPPVPVLYRTRSVPVRSVQHLP